MTDDNSFQVTPHDVRAQQFERGLRGYDIGQVEAFKLRVADELEAARTEEAQVHQRIEAANRQYAAYLHALRSLLDRHQGELASLETHLPEAARR